MKKQFDRDFRFRLTNEDFAHLEQIRQEWGLSSRSEAIRFLVWDSRHGLTGRPNPPPQNDRNHEAAAPASRKSASSR